MENTSDNQLLVTKAHYSIRKAQGVETRGKTARYRLKRVDIFIMMHYPEVLTRNNGAWNSAFYVDVGYGAYPWTTLESADKFWQLNSSIKILGVEIDNARVREAQKWEDNERVFFRQGGFNLPLKKTSSGSLEKIRLIRCFNVLRQCYEEDDVPKVHATLGSFLLDGGLLIEGTSDPPGRIWCTNVLRRRGDFVTLEAVVFSTNFQAGFEPEMFQPHLTKNFIHKMETQGEKIAQFFEMWKLAFKETLAIADFGIRQHFVACGLYLAQQYRINTQSKYLRKGFLIWYQ